MPLRQVPSKTGPTKAPRVHIVHVNQMQNDTMRAGSPHGTAGSADVITGHTLINNGDTDALGIFRRVIPGLRLSRCIPIAVARHTGMVCNMSLLSASLSVFPVVSARFA
jgi:hypothetical protein